MTTTTTTSPAPTGSPRWWTLGVLFGVVSALSILSWGPIGVSGTYPRLIGALVQGFDPEWAAGNAYLQKMGSLLKPETFLVLGLPIGGFLARRFFGGPTTCELIHRGERTLGARYRDAFIGGFLILFGARLAGGCTSGHIISGISQLSLSGFLFGGGVFATGILTAKLLSRRAA